MKHICSVGSINADLSIRVPRFVQPGETMRGSDFSFFPGGKGANQAVAAARVGAQVYLAGRIGGDPYGNLIRQQLIESGVRMDALEQEQGLSTGVAIIQVADSGQNAIVIDAGANETVVPLYLRRIQGLLDSCDILLLQLEIPFDTTLYTVKDYFVRGKTIILDPAPAVPLHDEVLRHVSIITPNETELAQLTGITVTDQASRLAACRQLYDRGAKIVLHKAGADGAYLYRGNGLEHFPTYEVEVADTTAAGDSFNGALAEALARDLPIEQAIEQANLVAAISTTRFGAQSAMPTMEQARAAALSLRKKSSPIEP